VTGSRGGKKDGRSNAGAKAKTSTCGAHRSQKRGDATARCQSPCHRVDDGGGGGHVNTSAQTRSVRFRVESAATRAPRSALIDAGRFSRRQTRPMSGSMRLAKVPRGTSSVTTYPSPSQSYRLAYPRRLVSAHAEDMSTLANASDVCSWLRKRETNQSVDALSRVKPNETHLVRDFAFVPRRLVLLNHRFGESTR